VISTFNGLWSGEKQDIFNFLWGCNWKNVTPWPPSFLANARRLFCAIHWLVGASVQWDGVALTVKSLPKWVVGISREIGHLYHDPVWTANVANLRADPLS
jgi:hypothetical protein